MSRKVPWVPAIGQIATPPNIAWVVYKDEAGVYRAVDRNGKALSTSSSTDATLVINAALTDCITNGDTQLNGEVMGCVALAASTVFTCLTTINIGSTGSGTSLVGLGPFLSTPVLDFNNSSALTDAITLGIGSCIQGVQIHINGSGTVTNAINCVTEFATVMDCEIENESGISLTTGILIDTAYCIVSNVIIEALGPSPTYGIQFGSNTNSCRITGCHILGCGTGVYLKGTEDVVNGLYIEAYANNQVGVNISGNNNSVSNVVMQSGVYSGCIGVNIAAGKTGTTLSAIETISGTNIKNLSGEPFGAPLVVASTFQKDETGADANVLTYTPAAAAGTYRLHFVADISADNSAVLGWTATWTDANGNARAPTNLPIASPDASPPFGLTPAAFTVSDTGATASTAGGVWEISVDNSATNIVIKTTFSGTSIAYKASAWIEEIV